MCSTALYCSVSQATAEFCIAMWCVSVRGCASAAHSVDVGGDNICNKNSCNTVVSMNSDIACARCGTQLLCSAVLHFTCAAHCYSKQITIGEAADVEDDEADVEDDEAAQCCAVRS